MVFGKYGNTGLSATLAGDYHPTATIAKQRACRMRLPNDENVLHSEQFNWVRLVQQLSVNSDGGGKQPALAARTSPRTDPS